MLVTLIGNNQVNKIILPKEIIGNYWITDNKDNKLVNIEAKDGKWQVKSTLVTRILEPHSVQISDNSVKLVNPNARNKR